jgi:hypothetical protein
MKRTTRISALLAGFLLVLMFHEGQVGMVATLVATAVAALQLAGGEVAVTVTHRDHGGWILLRTLSAFVGLSLLLLLFGFFWLVLRHGYEIQLEPSHRWVLVIMAVVGLALVALSTRRQRRQNLPAPVAQRTSSTLGAAHE